MRQTDRRQRLGLADDHRVDVRRERQRIRKRQWPARENERMRLVPFFTKHRNFGAIEQVHETRELELVSDREGHDRKARERRERLVRHRLFALAHLAVAEERALAHQAIGLHQRAIDAQKAEARHARVVGRRVREADPAGCFFSHPTDLRVEASADGGEGLLRRHLAHCATVCRWCRRRRATIIETAWVQRATAVRRERTAIARPIPRPLPVTRANLPCSRIGSSSLPVSGLKHRAKPNLARADVIDGLVQIGHREPLGHRRDPVPRREIEHQGRVGRAAGRAATDRPFEQ